MRRMPRSAGMKSDATLPLRTADYLQADMPRNIAAPYNRRFFCRPGFPTHARARISAGIWSPVSYSRWPRCCPFLNPPAVAPIFWTLTEGASNTTRVALAKRVAINVGVMLTIAMVAGNVLLTFFGLSLAIVRVGGGLLVITSAWRLVNSPDGGAKNAARAAESFTPEMAKARAFYPLTFPISCGPGSIAAAITVGASLSEPDRLVSLVKLAGSLPGILITSLILYGCLRFAAQFLYRLGDNGTAVFMRLSAFVLL